MTPVKTMREMNYTPWGKRRTGSFKNATIRDIVYISFAVTIAVSMVLNMKVPHMVAPVPVEASMLHENVVTPTPTPVSTASEINYPPEREEIASYIKEVFGVHADKAFQVLSCENASLNPEAVNTAGNYPEGSRDIGVFQINEYWQGVSNSHFLFDWKINVLMAYNIFSRDGYSFKLWSCGKKLGI